MAFVEDLSVFFTPDTPGIVAAVYNGGPTVYGEFEIRYGDPISDLSEDRAFLFTCPKDTLPAAKVDDVLVINGSQYKTWSVEPDTALALLRLELQP